MNEHTQNKHKSSIYTINREQLVEPIFDYLQKNNVNETSLILDGTGPRFSMQLPFLAGLGIDNIQSFKEIHAFSGGIGAYCVYLAQSLGALRFDLEYYYEAADKHARNSHRQPLLQYPKMLGNLLKKRPIYTELHYMKFFESVLTDDFLNASIDSVAPNFKPYIAHPDHYGPIAICSEKNFDRSMLSMHDVMSMSMKIPAIYSTPGETKMDQAYDATFTEGYWNMRNKLTASFDSAVVLSLFPRGITKQNCIIDLAKDKNVKTYLLFDMLTLVMNIPNKRYKNDLQMAYL